MDATPAPYFDPGTLFLIVGPSGAGKDSVIRGAREILSDDDRFVFARRTITRPAMAGGEAHIQASDAEFDRTEAAGGFCLSWRAHGLRYGIDRLYEDDIAARRAVIANVSRSVIDTARNRFPRIRVINITAPNRILAERLAARGRESAADIRRRLERAQRDVPQGTDVIELQNAGALADTVEAFIGVLRLRAFEAA